ncbi:DoxX family protein [Calidifontibacter sp. DB0510]|uniref:DoxX family protein n=1 Tax=Metallococcus carri TaxID=1656884 RepID=A0A967EBF8_9MICO|nr:DoxX family protein [Metallococcus carri]NHN57270.1 DoxX family protein [Metallococcus carri]NOP38125.1 DoxX family protein [Calidifontibacter sp. DB2511S]
MSLVRLIARPLLAAPFVVGGVSQLRNSDKLAGVAQPVTDKIAPAAKLPTKDPDLLVKANGAAMIVGGAMLATGRFPRLSSLLLSGLLVPTTVAGHSFWNETDVVKKRQQQTGFVTNLGLLGGLLLASVDTAGKPGLAYRAGMAKDSVERAAGTGKLRARLALAQAQSHVPTP